MTKHVLDRPRSASAARAEAYTRLERNATAHPATRTLQQRSRAEKDGRMKVYSEMERDQKDD